MHPTYATCGGCDTQEDTTPGTLAAEQMRTSSADTHRYAQTFRRAHFPPTCFIPCKSRAVNCTIINGIFALQIPPAIGGIVIEEDENSGIIQMTNTVARPCFISVTRHPERGGTKC